MYLRELKIVAPNFWVKHFRVNTQDFHLPQNRERIYIVGIRIDKMTMRLTCFVDRFPGRPPLLVEFLNLSLPNIDLDSLTQNYTENLENMKAHLQKDDRFSNEQHLGHVAVFYLCRKVGGAYCGGLWFDRVPTLKTKDHELFVISLGGSATTPMVQRYLYPEERIALQGLESFDCSGLGKCNLVKAIGNACSVPVAGNVLAYMFLNLGYGVHKPTNRKLVGKRAAHI
jgi:site-specific DNA-cytosine methylase